MLSSSFYLQLLLLQFISTDTLAKYASLVLVVVCFIGVILMGILSPKPLANDFSKIVDSRTHKYSVWVIVSNFLLYLVLLAGLGRIPDFIFKDFAVYFGLVVFIFGALFSIASRYYLGAGWSLSTTVSPNIPLAKNGPYKIVRHPFYLGLFLIWFGASFMFLNWLGLISSFLILLPLLYKKARNEEENLAKVFGDNYSQSMPSGVIFPRPS
ncbi:MAG: isoprenylcysteine carboxylmethyltransferase family protein [Candidatus Liptonbacteria bacterium]|nr:isoprenylcysteine carboxylmethyltransferase family protein [Candidatus Liptonbacteria bacterium]